jgi:galactose mutarotase-like enzyme
MCFPGDLVTSGITLHNDRLRVHVLPEEGGRITSFFDVRSRVEFLLQPSESYCRSRALAPAALKLLVVRFRTMETFGASDGMW